MDLQSLEAPGALAVVGGLIAWVLKLRRDAAATGTKVEEEKTEAGVIGKLHIEFQRMSAALLEERKENDRLRARLVTADQETAQHAVATVRARADAEIKHRECERERRENDRLRDLISKEHPKLAAKMTPRFPNAPRMHGSPGAWPADAPTPPPPS